MPKLKLEDSDLSPIVASTIYQLGLPSTNAMKSLCHVSLWPLDWIRSLSPSKLWRKPSWPGHIMVSKACYATQIYSLIQKTWPADWNTGYIKSALIHLHWALSIDCWRRESFAINIDQCTAAMFHRCQIFAKSSNIIWYLMITFQHQLCSQVWVQI